MVELQDERIGLAAGRAESSGGTEPAFLG